MELQDLKKVIPYRWRVQSTNEYGSSCVAYIDARDVQDLLDEVCGAENWQVKYSEHKGNLFASIGIDMGKGWVWKSDCGTESNVEKQKGEASDAFKRAAVMWGVGRFLYSLDIIKIKEVVKVGNRFAPAHNGKRIYDINKHCNNLINLHELKLSDANFKATLENGTKAQIQKVLNTFEVTDIQKKALMLTKAFTDGSK